MKILPIRKNVIFQFAESTVSGRFINSTESGIIVTSDDKNQTGSPRWVRITHVGPDVDEEIKPGTFALVEAGKWTIGFYVDSIRYWKTEESFVMALSDEPYHTY